MALRILSYNVHGLPWIRCPIETILLWEHIRCKSDVICLQEVFTTSLKQQILTAAPKYNLQAFFPQNEPSCFGKNYMRFSSPSGLCILTKKGLKVNSPCLFTPFLEKGGVDHLVTKGYFSLAVEKHGKSVEIFNTHFQSDMTDIPCIRINYPNIRNAQEEQLYLSMNTRPLAIACGDFNKKTFSFFERFDPNDATTFPQTGEHLDHLLFFQKDSFKLRARKTTYFSEMPLSDHIPVLYEFEI